MKSHTWIVAACICAVVMAPWRSAAQKFQEPSRDELQMTADPKAPGAPAVYFYREETTDNFSHYVSEYARIKVLTELGKEWATLHIPYLPGYQGRPVVEARTIHPDGTVVKLTVTEDDLLTLQRKAIHEHEIVVNLPDVTVGSILEYRWTRAMTGIDLHFFEKLGEADRREALAGLGSSELAQEVPQWEVQKRLFIHKERFYFNPFNDLQNNVIGNQHITVWENGERASYILYTQHLPAGAQVMKSPKNDFSLDVQNVAPLVNEPNAPPEGALHYRVRFYYSPYLAADVYWDAAQKHWSKRLDQYADAGGVAAAAAQITAAAATAEAKARKLYDAVQALDNTDFSRAMSEAERRQMHLRELRKASDVLAQKSGSGNDLAALYLGLARAAGLEAYGVQVSDRSRRLFDQNYLSLDQLDALLVLVRIDGKDVYVDPGEKLCPFGQLKWSHTLAGGLAQNSKTPIFTPANATKDAITAHAAELTLDAQGNVTGTLKVLMNGPEALHWRQLNLTADTSEVQRQFGESLRRLLPAGITAETASFKGLETADGYLQATVNVQGQLGTATGKRLLLPAFLFSTGARPMFVEEKRESVVDLHFAEQVIDEMIVHLPIGYAVESAPPGAQLPWPDHAALVVKVASTPGTIDVKHIFARAFVVLDPNEYASLRDYYQKVATTDQQQIVLTPAAATGN